MMFALGGILGVLLMSWTLWAVEENKAASSVIMNKQAEETGVPRTTPAPAVKPRHPAKMQSRLV